MFKIEKITDHVLLFKLVLIGLLIYKLSTIKLWIISERIFPVISVSDNFQVTDEIFHNSLSILSFLLLSFLVFKTIRGLLILLIAVEILLLSTDVMRWQPTVYQFVLSFIIYAIKPKYFKFYILLLLSATYFYSGLLKFNLSFINYNWSGSILIDFLGVPSHYAYSKPLKALGFLIPIIEVSSGILLLTQWRKKGFILVVITHVFILVFLTHVGFVRGFAIWSWNVIMLIYAFIFIRNPQYEKPKFNLTTTVWLVIIYLLPFLNVFGKYYPYFSFDMFTGDRFYLFINTPSEKDNLMRTYAKNKDTFYLSESVSLMAFNELYVPLTHSKWLHRRFISAYKRDFPDSSPCFEWSYYPFKTKEALDDQ